LPLAFIALAFIALAFIALAFIAFAFIAFAFIASTRFAEGKRLNCASLTDTQHNLLVNAKNIVWIARNV